MKCLHCGQLLKVRICPSCSSEVLEESLFCHRCGIQLVPLKETSFLSSDEEEGIDFSKRLLCSDGTCIGVIDENGYCKVCGKPYSGESASPLK